MNSPLFSPPEHLTTQCSAFPVPLTPGRHGNDGLPKTTGPNTDLSVLLDHHTPELGGSHADAQPEGAAADPLLKAPTDDSLREPLRIIRTAIRQAKDGDVGAPLERGCVSAMVRLHQHSRAEYQRVRAQFKTANKQVSLGALDAAVNLRLAAAGTPATHHGYAADIIERLTVDGWPPVGHAGALYVVDSKRHIWVCKEPGALGQLIAQTHDGKDNCTRRSDYTGIALHAMESVRDDSFFAEAPVGLACGDGFYRVNGNEAACEPLTPAHRQRVLLDVSPRPQPTPMFGAFLHDTFASKHDGEEQQQRALVQEIAGAIMLGLMPRHHKAVLFYEPYGRAGKGTLERILTALVPKEFVTAVSPFNWNKDYHVATLSSARLNVVGELPDNEPIPAAIVKSVLGGDLITGRHPTQRPITFKNEAAHLFMSNHLINSRDQSDAFFARWLLIEFPNSRLRSGLPLDPTLAPRIIDTELPGIAHWALEGAMRLLRNGRFSGSSAHDRLMTAWRRSNSSLEEFIHECCTRDSALYTRRSMLYRRYKSWCADNGRKPFAKARVKEMLEHNVGLGISLSVLDGYEIFRGVELKPDEDDAYLGLMYRP